MTTPMVWTGAEYGFPRRLRPVRLRRRIRHRMAIEGTPIAGSNRAVRRRKEDVMRHSAPARAGLALILLGLTASCSSEPAPDESHGSLSVAMSAAATSAARTAPDGALAQLQAATITVSSIE